MDQLKDIIPATLHFGEATKIHDKLGVIPILNDAVPGIPPLFTLEEAIENSTIHIREVDQAGAVPFLIVENRGGCGVLILDNEIVLGGKQDRLFDQTVLVPVGAELKIRVSCVERHRWDQQPREFSSGNSIFRASSRAVHKQSISASIRRNGELAADQHSVWQEVARSHAEFDTNSRTGAFQDVQNHLSCEIHSFIESIRPVPNQSGVIFFDHNGVMGTELLATAELFTKSVKKIAKSFLMDSITALAINGASPEPAMQWWRDALGIKYTKHKSVGVGDDIRVEGTNLVGSGLVYGGEMIHLSAFPLSGNSSERSHRSSRSSASARRRNLLRLN